MRFLLTALLICGAAMAQPAQRAAPPKGQRPTMSEADKKALSTYDLTTDKVQKMVTVTERVSKLPPDERSQMHHREGGAGLDAMTKQIESNPKFSGLLEQQRMSARDYLLTSMAVAQAVMVNGLRQQRPDMQIPPGVNPKNIDWVKQHPNEIQEWSRVLRSMVQAADAGHAQAEPQQAPAK